MPVALRELCDHLDATGYPISGSMRLRPEGEGLKIWFGADSAAWKMLAGFGAGPDGSTLAFWLVAGSEPAQSPVVHLGSEGDALKVIAKDLEDFLLLFGVGYGELGFADLSLPPDEPESAQGLRQWLQSRFGLVPPATGQDIAARAQGIHPDFEAWVYQAQRLRDFRRSLGSWLRWAHHKAR